MYKVDNRINELEFNDLHIEKLGKAGDAEVMIVFIEKGTTFSKHTSPKDAHLILLDGDIIFHLENESYDIGKNQHFRFEKDVLHWVEAKEDSKILIVR